MRKIMRQGDVLIVEVTEIPQEAKKTQEGTVILAYGEVTGHMHQIQNPGAVMYAVNENLRFIKLEEDVELRHEEHSPIHLPSGNYQIIQQREKSLEGIVRAVAD